MAPNGASTAPERIVPTRAAVATIARPVTETDAPPTHVPANAVAVTSATTGARDLRVTHANVVPTRAAVATIARPVTETDAPPTHVPANAAAVTSATTGARDLRVTVSLETDGRVCLLVPDAPECVQAAVMSVRAVKAKVEAGDCVS